MGLLSQHLREEDILLDVEAVDRPDLFGLVGRHMFQRYGLRATSVAAALDRREQAESTALGQGVAIPHARLAEVDAIHVAYVRLKRPMPFRAPDRAPVSDLLVLLVPSPAAPDHLDLLAEAAQLFSDEPFRLALRQSTDAKTVKILFDRRTI